MGGVCYWAMRSVSRFRIDANVTSRPIADVDCLSQDRLMGDPPSKSGRMELRRSVGNRKVTGPYVPPYHRRPDYLIAHACFDCRKSWKWHGDTAHSCPQCRGPLAMMGQALGCSRRLMRLNGRRCADFGMPDSALGATAAFPTWNAFRKGCQRLTPSFGVIPAIRCGLEPRVRFPPLAEVQNVGFQQRRAMSAGTMPTSQTDPLLTFDR